MATLTAARAATTFPVAAPAAGAGVLCTAYGTYTLTANPSAADVLQACRIPAGATVIGGWLRGEDIDSGTAALDIDIGWTANGMTVWDVADGRVDELGARVGGQRAPARHRGVEVGASAGKPGNLTITSLACLTLQWCIVAMSARVSRSFTASMLGW